MAQPGQHYIEDFFIKSGHDARLQRGDGERLARRAAPHRLRRQGALRVLRRVGGVQGRGGRAAARGDAVLARRLHAARTGTSSTPAATASSSRTSSPSACARCETKWRATGYPIEEMPGVLPIDSELGPEEIAERQIKLIEGRRDGRAERHAASHRPRSRSSTSTSIARVAQADAANGDADDDPVGLLRRRPLAPADRQRLDRRRSRARRPNADLTLETSWADWIGVSIRGEDPRRRCCAGGSARAARCAT